MRLVRATYSDFRNLASAALDFSPRATVVVGPNGQGKTNLLEGVYFLATLKQLRGTAPGELVRFGAASSRVAGRFLLGGAERDIAVEVSQGKRAALVDGKRASSLEAYFGGVSVVAFTPDDLQVVKGGPEGRRSFLDRAVFNRFPGFLEESRRYARALKGRNRLLKDGAAAAQLEAWDEALSTAGARVWARRRALLLELRPRAEEAFGRISRSGLGLELAYAAAQVDGAALQALDEAGLRGLLLEGLARRLPRDTERRYTSVGPHADDVEVRLGGQSARHFASQGQARALVLAWKVAEIENLQASNGFLPLLLLDDVSSELDPQRNSFLMRYLAERGAQTLLTTTDPRLVEAAAAADTAWYRVQEGRVSAGGP